MTSAVTPFPKVSQQPAEAVSDLLRALGEDPDRDGLQRTPERVARSLAFLTSGRQRSAREAVGEGLFEGDYDSQVLVRDIEFYSLCEHHLLPFRGVVHVAYLPSGRIVGLSKLPRIVEVFARRLQVQERLTQQVAEAIDEILSPRGVAIVVEAEHFCMLMRGVEKQQSRTRTSVFTGAYETDATLRGELIATLAPRTEYVLAVPDPVRHAAKKPSPSSRRAGRRVGTRPAQTPRGHRCPRCSP